jgi:hypothetical protein
MKDKEQWWLASFLMLPFFGAKILADNLAESKDMELLYAMIFCGFSMLVGYGLYSFTKDKAAITRLITLGTIVVAFAVSTIVLSSNHYPITCQICGYKAIEKGDSTCGECFEEISEASMKEKGYKNLTELVYARQLYVFYQDSLEQVDFYKPEVTEDGYEKDKNWKPIITKDDLLDIQNEMKNIE